MGRNTDKLAVGITNVAVEIGNIIERSRNAARRLGVIPAMDITPKASLENLLKWLKALQKGLDTVIQGRVAENRLDKAVDLLAGILRNYSDLTVVDVAQRLEPLRKQMNFANANLIEAAPYGRALRGWQKNDDLVTVLHDFLAVLKNAIYQIRDIDTLPLQDIQKCWHMLFPLLPDTPSKRQISFILGDTVTTLSTPQIVLQNILAELRTLVADLRN